MRRQVKKPHKNVQDILNLNMYFFICLFIVINVSTLYAEVFTSTAQLEQVLRIEREVVAVLEDYLVKNEQKLDKIRNYVRDYGRIITDDYSLNVDNPLNAYHLMKRLAIDWVHVENEMQEHDWWTILSDIKGRRSVLNMPAESDLYGAALALIRLKQTYHLNVTELSQGNLQGILTQVHLTARDCLYLGLNTMASGTMNHAIEWLEQAMILAAREGNQTATQEEIRPHLQEAIFKYDKSQRTKHLQTSAYMSDKPEDNYDLHKHFVKELAKFTIGLHTTGEDDQRNYEALCRGERLRSPQYEAQLKCYYKTGPHPYLRLRHIKVEENHLHPPLYTFHDVVSDKEIDLIKMLAKPMLQRSTVVGTNGEWRQVSDTRTSKNMWIYQSIVEEQPILKRLHERMNWITGMNVATEDDAEALQVANYGVGGHYVYHHDYLFQHKTPQEMAGVDPRDFALGDRLATFMFYLSDVSRGGATVFPKMGAAVWPKKGAAAYWHNIDQTGEGDIMTLHGACPVLHGSKWVANKWIRQRSQVFNNKCTATENN